MKVESKLKPLYSVFYIDAWADCFEGWTCNNQFKLFEFRSNAANVKRVFLRRLRKFLKDGVRTIAGTRNVIDLGRGWYRVEGDWDIMELCRRSDGCPYYACIMENQ